MNSLKYHTTLLLFFFVISKGLAQDSLNSATVEQKSYQLYLDKNWPELIKFGNKAIHSGFDYYYLQLRVGIAYYEKKNYALAEGHFKKALTFNTDDELSLEYIYYCYLFNGRYEDARMLSKQFNQSLADKIGTSTQSKVGFVMVEGGTKITDSIEYYNKAKNRKPNYFKPPTYFQIGLNHYIKNRVSLFHAATYFNQETFLGKTTQLQYFLKTTIPVKNNWLIASSVHVVDTKNSFSSVTTSTMFAPYQGGGPPPPGSPPPPVITKTTVVNETKKATYYVGALAAQKIIKKFTFGIGSTVSNIAEKNQFIHSASISYAILGNSKIVLGCSGYLHSNDVYKTSYGAATPFLYIQPIKRLSMKLSYLLNSGNNIIEDNGYLVNNSADLTLSRYSALLNLTLNKHLSLYGLYQLEYKHEAVQSFNYRYNVIVAGLKIIP